MGRWFPNRRNSRKIRDSVEMITIKLYANLRENRGKELKIDHKEKVTVEDILLQLEIEREDASIILINGVHSKLDTELKDEDKLLLFPPVGGG